MMRTVQRLRERSDRDVIERYNAVNERVKKAIRERIFNPRTKVVGIADEFAVDISTGNILVKPVENDEVAEGYLTHENGHRAAFPVSVPGHVAYTVAVARLGLDPNDPAVQGAMNVVADAFSDLALLAMGFGERLSKRIPHFLAHVDRMSVAAAFKSLVYASIYLATRNGSAFAVDFLDEAYRMLSTQFPRDVLDRAYSIAKNFMCAATALLTSVDPRLIARYLASPYSGEVFGKGFSIDLSFLPKTVKMLLAEEQRLQMGVPGCGRGSGNRTDRGSSTVEAGRVPTEDRGASSTSDRGREGEGAKDRGKGGGVESGDAERSAKNRSEPVGRRGGFDVEGIDIVNTKKELDPVEVGQALMIALASYGVHPSEGGALIERVWSEEIKRAVEKLLEKMKLVYAQNDFRVYRPAGTEKRTSELWLHPMGEPDEDSMLIEKRKLLWTVRYKKYVQRGREAIAPASVPRDLVVVIDESESTLDRFRDTSVLSVEAFVSLLVLAGLRYVKGAKKIDVVKFSTFVEHVYSGSDEVEAGTKIVVPSSIAGQGTNIVWGVRKGLSLATKNSALVVVTDAVIPDDVALSVASMLRKAVETGKVGFVVFIVVNEESVPAIDVIRSELKNANAIVEHIRSASDLTRVSQKMINHILRVYSPK